MAAVSRTAQFSKVFKILKKCYEPVAPRPERPVLEHLLLACCLENAQYPAAEEAVAALAETFFDWNEVRVTSIAELAEVLSSLPDPKAAANRVKRVLQSVFEETYSFDLEEHRKKNLGPTVKWLQKLDGTTGYTVAYVVQSALGGHAIPADRGVLRALRIVHLVTDKDVEAGVVPGLERAVAKSKGIEFGSLLHQLGADFTANPYSPAVHKVLLEINPDCAGRLPKRRAPKLDKGSSPGEASGKVEGEPAAAKEEPVADAGRRRSKAAEKTAAAEKTSAVEKGAPVERKKPASTRKRPATPEEVPPADPEAKGKRSPAERLSKRKPR